GDVASFSSGQGYGSAVSKVEGSSLGPPMAGPLAEALAQAVALINHALAKPAPETAADVKPVPLGSQFLSDAKGKNVMQGKGDGDQGVVGDLFGKGGEKEKAPYCWSAPDSGKSVSKGAGNDGNTGKKGAAHDVISSVVQYADLGLGMQGVEHAGNPTQAVVPATSSCMVVSVSCTPDVVAMAAVPEATMGLTESGRSKRRNRSGNGDSMQRASKLKVARNLDAVLSTGFVCGNNDKSWDKFLELLTNKLSGESGSFVDAKSVALEREEKESDGLYYRPELDRILVTTDWEAKYPLSSTIPHVWAKNTSGHYKKQKKDLLDKLDDLDEKAERAKIFQLKDGALKKHITTYYKFWIYPKTFIKEIYPSIVLILCRDAEIIQQNIMEGVVVLHETIHELHRNKQSGVIFKIDFEKAYDKWIAFIMTGGHVGIKTHKGAKADGQVDGLVPHLKAANMNYFVSIFGCKKGGLRNNDWKMIEENLAMFMLSFFEDGIWQSIDTFAITSSKEIGMGTKNVGFNVIVLMSPELSLHYPKKSHDAQPDDFGDHVAQSGVYIYLSS
ncbi:hypothetical protein ACJX0J_019283, partial [Zea mays]